MHVQLKWIYCIVRLARSHILYFLLLFWYLVIDSGVNMSFSNDLQDRVSFAMFISTCEQGKLPVPNMTHQYFTLSKGKKVIQSNLVISNSHISNYRLSRSENLVPVLTWNYDNRLQNNVEKRRNCSTIFSVYLYFQESNYIFICEMWLFDLSFFFLNSANLICRDTDISKYFRESLSSR